MSVIKKGLLVFAVLLSQLGLSQVTGLWKVMKIRVAGEETFPVAQWIRIHDNARFESGHGGLQHEQGLWMINGYSLTLEADNRVKDTLGPFEVSYPGDYMAWTRREGDVLVEVFFEHVREIPQSFVDRARGIWVLQSFKTGSFDRTSEMRGDGSGYLELTWNGLFTMTFPGKNTQKGKYWVDYKEPYIALYPDDGKPSEFSLNFDKEIMVLTHGMEEWRLKRVLQKP